MAKLIKLKDFKKSSVKKVTADLKKKKQITSKSLKTVPKTVPALSDDQSDLALIVAKNYQAQILPLSKKVSSITITSQEQYEAMAEAVKKIKSIDKQATAKQKSWTGPLNKVVKSINKYFKPLHDSVKLIDKTSKSSMEEWIKSQQNKKDKLANKLESGSIGLKTFMAKTKDLEVVSSFSSVRTLQVLQIDDESEIPEEYMMPNRELIIEALKKGDEVPGCRLVDKPNISI